MNKVNQLKSDIEHICLRNGIKKFHFNDIDMDKRKTIYPELIGTVLKYENVTYDILEHRKPVDYIEKDFYLNFLPKEYARRFDFLKHKDGIIRVDIHDDFDVAGVKDSTNHLSEALAKETSKKFLSKENIFRKREIIFSTVKCKETGSTLLFNFRKVTGHSSNAIIVADIVLGFHRLKFKTHDNLFPHTNLDVKFLNKVTYKNITP